MEIVTINESGLTKQIIGISQRFLPTPPDHIKSVGELKRREKGADFYLEEAMVY